MEAYQISNSHHTNDNRTWDHQFFLAHSAYLGPVYRMNESLGVALASVYAQPLIAAAKICGCWGWGCGPFRCIENVIV